jgi:hypothetical protein
VHDDLTSTQSQDLINPYNLPKDVSISKAAKGDREHDSCLGQETMPTLEEQLEIWIKKRCSETGAQVQQFDGLNSIFRDINKDRRFWRYRDNRCPDDYEEALCLMWQYFVRNLCEAETARERGPFIDTYSFAVPRLLESLKGNLKNLWIERKKKREFEAPTKFDSDGNPIDPVAQLPNPGQDSEPEIDPVAVFNVFLKLVEEDPEGELKAEINTLRGIKKSTRETTRETYVLTAQEYLLMRYRDRKTDQQIAVEVDMSRQTLQPHGGKPKRWTALARGLAQKAQEIVLKQGG